MLCPFKALSKHIFTAHNTHLYLYPCEWCGIKCQSVSALRRHAAAKHPDLTVREPLGFFTNYPAPDAVPIPRIRPAGTTVANNTTTTTVVNNTTSTNQPRINDPSRVRFKTVMSTFVPKRANKQLPFSEPKKSSLHTTSPATPGTPVQDEPHNRIPPTLVIATNRLEKHQQVL